MVVITESLEKRFTDNEFIILSAKRGLVAPPLKVRNIYTSCYGFAESKGHNLPSTICSLFIHSLNFSSSLLQRRV